MIILNLGLGFILEQLADALMSDPQVNLSGSVLVFWYQTSIRWVLKQTIRLSGWTDEGVTWHLQGLGSWFDVRLSKTSAHGSAAAAQFVIRWLSEAAPSSAAFPLCFMHFSSSSRVIKSVETKACESDLDLMCFRVFGSSFEHRGAVTLGEFGR